VRFRNGPTEQTTCSATLGAASSVAGTSTPESRSDRTERHRTRLPQLSRSGPTSPVAAAADAPARSRRAAPPGRTRDYCLGGRLTGYRASGCSARGTAEAVGATPLRPLAPHRRATHDSGRVRLPPPPPVSRRVQDRTGHVPRGAGPAFGPGRGRSVRGRPPDRDGRRPPAGGRTHRAYRPVRAVGDWVRLPADSVEAIRGMSVVVYGTPDPVRPCDVVPPGDSTAGPCIPNAARAGLVLHR
jgi:hypothetical protein